MGGRQDHAPQCHEALRPRETGTVGALKAEGADVDVSIQSMGRPKDTPFTGRLLAERARPK